MRFSSLLYSKMSLSLFYTVSLCCRICVLVFLSLSRTCALSFALTLSHSLNCCRVSVAISCKAIPRQGSCRWRRCWRQQQRSVRSIHTKQRHHNIHQRFHFGNSLQTSGTIAVKRKSKRKTQNKRKTHKPKRSTKTKKD